MHNEYTKSDFQAKAGGIHLNGHISQWLRCWVQASPRSEVVTKWELELSINEVSSDGEFNPSSGGTDD